MTNLEKRENNILEKPEVEKLLSAPLETKGPKILQLRDKAILELLFSTGLKVFELANLQQKQMDLKKKEFTVINKQGQPRAIFLPNQTKYWLKKYLTARRDSFPSLFIRHDRAIGKIEPNNLTSRSIQRLIQKYVKAIGINQIVTPHTLRQIFATRLLESNLDLKSVQTALGHVSINTTKLYQELTK